ncbi:FAD-dependent oxidoreductase, partial [Dehalococcoidia bacterium]|nr:FAD-dependent oxidoreductase [Dehalococcoidia bacterium]
MPSNRTDVLVIGAGCVGVTTAYFLAQGGARVTLIDQGEICAGCSYGNAGQISPSHSVPLAAPGVIWQALRWMVDPESPFYIQPRMSLKLLSWLWQFRASCTEENVARAMPVIRDLSLMSIEIYDKFNNIEGVNFSYAKKGVLKLFLTDK